MVHKIKYSTVGSLLLLQFNEIKRLHLIEMFFEAFFDLRKRVSKFSFVIPNRNFSSSMKHFYFYFFHVLCCFNCRLPLVRKLQRSRGRCEADEFTWIHPSKKEDLIDQMTAIYKSEGQKSKGFSKKCPLISKQINWRVENFGLVDKWCMLFQAACVFKKRFNPNSCHERFNAIRTM
jgi:hypothetical protein